MAWFYWHRLDSFKDEQLKVISHLRTLPSLQDPVLSCGLLISGRGLISKIWGSRWSLREISEANARLMPNCIQQRSPQLQVETWGRACEHRATNSNSDPSKSSVCQHTTDLKHWWKTTSLKITLQRGFFPMKVCPGLYLKPWSVQVTPLLGSAGSLCAVRALPSPGEGEELPGTSQGFWICTPQFCLSLFSHA